MTNPKNPVHSPESIEATLFAAALDRSPSERATFLDGACLGNMPLRQRIEALLAAHEAADSLPEPEERKPGGKPLQTIKLDLAEAPDEAVGETLGRYKLLERVGEGGCGVVYVAEQTEPVRRRVALKVIKLGMDTKQVVARFEAERQALAMMDHPNIAKVLDAGTTDVGRPFFVMELVRGIRITDYCDQANLSTKERLDLFIKVCHAIQHAHQKGIIHRDIKPSNILVTLHDGVPVPKVIDFGIAKATEGRLTDNTVYTQLHQFIGTPAYMSPEQAEMSGLDIDTRSDIYSLGVLLYELLAGSTPFDAKELMASGIDAMRKTIREKEPQRPSTKLATLQGEELTTTAKRRSVETSKLANLLRGDLDWIVMKCLEKDRTRRYETANGLAADLKRHLNHEPVVARPPSTAYRFQKAFRRNKLVFVAGTAVFAALCLGVITTTFQSIRATHAKREALVARSEAETNEKKAVAAQASEATLREQAQANELVARQRAYASDMNVAMQVFEDSNLGRALDMINRQRPKPGQKDLRGWEWRYLWGQTRSDAIYTLCQIDGEVSSVAVSPDANWLAVGPLHKGGLTVWDLRTRQQSIRLSEDEGQIYAAFSLTGSLLAYTGESASSNGTLHTLHLWNTATRRMEAELPLEKACIGLVFSQDGKTLVTSSYNGPIVLWKMPEGAKLARYDSTQNTIGVVDGFATTPDLDLGAYGFANNQIRVVDLHNGQEQWKATTVGHYITALRFSPDGKTLASASGFGESDIKLWNVATGKQIGQLEGHTSWVGSIVFWPDGKKLASASADQTIRIWDVASGKCLDVMRGHRDEAWRLKLLPDNVTLVSGSKDGEVCLWDTTRTHPSRGRITIPDRVFRWSFTPDGREIVTFDRQGHVARWSGSDFQNKEKLWDMPLSDLGGDLSAGFSGGGRLLAIGSTNGMIRVWDVAKRLVANEFKLPDRPGFMGITRSGDHLMIGSKDQQTTHIWNIAAHPATELESWPTVARISAATYSLDERIMAQLGNEGDTVVRDLKTPKTTFPKLAFLEPGDCGFSQDGKLFAVSSRLGYVRVWTTIDWQEVTTLRGFQLGAQSVAFSPDTHRLATGSGYADDAVKLWDVASWQQVLSLKAAGSIFGSAEFSPDGKAIATSSNDGFLQVWRAPTWGEINAAEAKSRTEAQPK